MKPYICGNDSEPSEGPLIRWTPDKLALLEARLELAQLKGQDSTTIDGHKVMVEFGIGYAKALALEFREREAASRAKPSK